MLNSARVLILEDEPLVGFDLANAVKSANGVVVGPLPSVYETLELLGRQTVSAAIIDFRLIDRDATPVVERLVSDGTPMLFYTGNSLPPAITLAYPHIPVFKKITKPEFLLRCLFDIIDANKMFRSFTADPSHQTLADIANKQISKICVALELDTDYFEKAQDPDIAMNQMSRFEQLQRIADALHLIVDLETKSRLETLLLMLADDANVRDERRRLAH